MLKQRSPPCGAGGGSPQQSKNSHGREVPPAAPLGQQLTTPIPTVGKKLRRTQAGGFVRDNRINGALNVSRTIGDLDFKRNAELPPAEQMVGGRAGGE